MAKLVLTTRPNSPYQDLPEIQYQFPRTYLNQVESGLDDFFIYYSPRRGNGVKAYFAVGRIQQIVPDPKSVGMFFALISDYLAFENLVPFKAGTEFYESNLRRPDGHPNRGQFGRAVRAIEIHEFEAILRAGFEERPLQNATDSQSELHLHEPPSEFDRPIIQTIQNRYFRDAAFSHQVRTAYNATCAATGLRMINGGNRAEMEAAHIKPVANQGPDSVRNGIALCRTAHWMFDRGLISVSDSYEILVSPRLQDESALRLLRPDRRLTVPSSAELQPHPKFLTHHRRQWDFGS